MSISADIAQMLDPVLFAKACGITPDPWQADLLRRQPKRALLLCSRQSGKTTTTALLAAHRAIYEQNALIIIVSPSQPQSDEMLRTIKRLYSNMENPPELINGGSVQKIELKNGSRILAKPGSESSTRGFAGVSLVIIDEASRVSDELIPAVRPMLATRSDGSLIALTTPNGKRGWFYDAWIGESPTWHRIKVAASDCPRISKEHLDEEMREMGPTKFAQEYGLEFCDDQESAFNTEIIEAAFTSEFKALWI